MAAAESTALASRAEAAGARLLAIRRPDRRSADGDRVWGLADVRPGGAGIRWGTWSLAADLLRLDLAADLSAEGSGRPAALVCTHGGRDSCCAVFGRPVLTALTGRSDLDIWECSHLGGHRFAGNLLRLPSGLLYGRVDACTAAAVADAELAGRIVTPLLRGRCGLAAVEQAAEILVRQAWDENRADVVQVSAAAPDGDDVWRVPVTRAGRPAEARIAVRQGRSGPVSCGQDKTESILLFDLVELVDRSDQVELVAPATHRQRDRGGVPPVNRA